VAGDKGKLKSLRDEVALLRSVIDKSPSMLAYWDTQQRCRFANAAYQQWFGVNPQALVGTTLDALLGPVYAQNLPYIQGALRGEVQHFEREIPDPKGGAPRYSQADYLPDVIDGVVRGFVVLVSDITERRQLELRLREAQERAETIATHDVLTGLPNRVLLEDRIQHAVELAKRHKRRCGVMVLDLDEFKVVNDTHGHPAGDAVLREVSRRLRATLRKSDTVARLGGDEFVVLLPEVGQRDVAAMVARRLVTVMSRDAVSIGERSLPLTLSLGVALYPDDGADMAELLAHADSALYEAKRGGRNQFAFFTAPQRSA
jgi:diguanylate cyclase (GGDEF)-like protein/PAS domain S-box-containing protein